MISQEIRQQAADWAVELTTTRPTAQRWDEFEGWIAMSPQHREAYTRAERAWRASPTEVSQTNASRLRVAFQSSSSKPA
jgi:ferric-dicitrate binding protein FerR (iron transport regulator)